MSSPERRHQLKGLTALRQTRKAQAIRALQRAQAAAVAVRLSIDETLQALKSLEAERVSLFERHRGATHRAGLLSLRRQASQMEMRRIHLALARVQLEADLLAAQEAEKTARLTVASTQKQYDKLEHVACLWRRHAHIHMQHQLEEAS